MNENVVPSVYVTHLQNVMKLDEMMNFDIRNLSTADRIRRAKIISAGVPGHPNEHTQSSYNNVIKNVFLVGTGGLCPLSYSHAV